MATVTYSQLLADHARARPHAPAVTCGDDRLDWAGFVAAGARAARVLAGAGVGQGDFVTIALPNCIEYFTAFAGCWNLGAIPQPVSAKLPAREIAEIVALADSAVVVGDLPAGHVAALGDRAVIGRSALHDATVDDRPFPTEAVSPAWKAPTSGGSTGRPKLIVAGEDSTWNPETPPGVGVGPDGCLVMPGPLYHNGPLVWSVSMLRNGGHVVVLPRFDPTTTLQAVDDHEATVLYLVPTMMQRIWKLPEEVRRGFDLSSLKIVWHLAAPCPDWLKEEWINWLGAERIVELYAGTEAQVATVITGVEWLAHRGSVGKPVSGEVRILDEDRQPVPAGTPGEVFLRGANPDAPTYRYVGASPDRTDDGFETLGDMGWVDDDGYLYLGDRKKDMILSGGANIYPAEVEAAIDRHPAVGSCAVIGLDHEDLGQSIHAIVFASDGLEADDLSTFLRDQLVSYKIPRTYEFVDTPVRDDAGKVRRSALAAERS